MAEKLKSHGCDIIVTEWSESLAQKNVLPIVSSGRRQRASSKIHYKPNEDHEASISGNHRRRTNGIG